MTGGSVGSDARTFCNGKTTCSTSATRSKNNQREQARCLGEPSSVGAWRMIWSPKTPPKASRSSKSEKPVRGMLGFEKTEAAVILRELRQRRVFPVFRWVPLLCAQSGAPGLLRFASFGAWTSARKMASG